MKRTIHDANLSPRVQNSNPKKRKLTKLEEESGNKVGKLASSIVKVDMEEQKVALPETD